MSGHYLGLDLGGTKIEAGVLTDAGAILARRRIATSELRDGPETLPNLVRLGLAVMADAGVDRVQGVGVALPGPVDQNPLRLLAAPTIPEIEGVPLDGPLREAFHVPVAGDNDANACALAESRFGAGRGQRHVVYVTVSTGIGGGIVVDGRVFRGARGTSGEFGHQIVAHGQGPRCDCGATGCLEALASGRGIAWRAEAWLRYPEAPASALRGREPLTAEDVAAAARAGDKLAQEVWTETARCLAIGLSNVINVLDPDVIILGGGVALGAADLLLPPLREWVDRICMPSLSRHTPIVTAVLGADLGLIAAAVLAMPAAE
jgi:glucokinase